MDVTQIFYAEFFVIFLVCLLVAGRYVMPKLRSLPLMEALLPLTLFSSLRVLGLNFLNPNLTSGLDMEYARQTAYGDFSVAIVALLASIALYYRSKVGVWLAWIYGIAGLADFLYSFSQASKVEFPLHLTGTWVSVMFVGPAAFLTCFLILITLWKRRSEV